jgi:hypothetical protein
MSMSQPPIHLPPLIVPDLRMPANFEPGFPWLTFDA